MLRLDGVNQYYGQSHILRDAALDVPAGSCTCLMGRNGVGKTTLLKVIMGLLKPRSGSVRLDGRPLTGLPAHARAELGVGYVPQGRDIFPLLSVEENLRVGLPRRALPEDIFRLFPILKTMLRRRGGDLSGGQQQQLAIGRALVLKPKLLILDEPTEGIQPNVVQQIGEVIETLNRERGLTVLLVEQKLPFARRVAQRFCMLERGAAVAAGTIEELDERLIRRHLAV